MKPWEVAAVDQLAPPLQVPLVWLAGHAIAETIEVVVDSGLPLFKAAVVQLGGESAVEVPRPAFGAGELGNDGPANDLKTAAHARQEPVELLVAEVDSFR